MGITQLGDVKSAMKSTNRALELDPGYLKAKMKRVNLYIELEEYDEAVREAEQCYKTETNEGEYLHLYWLAAQQPMNSSAL